MYILYRTIWILISELNWPRNNRFYPFQIHSNILLFIFFSFRRKTYLNYVVLLIAKQLCRPMQSGCNLSSLHTLKEAQYSFSEEGNAFFFQPTSENGVFGKSSFDYYWTTGLEQCQMQECDHFS